MSNGAGDGRYRAPATSARLIRAHTHTRHRPTDPNEINEEKIQKENTSSLISMGWVGGGGGWQASSVYASVVIQCLPVPASHSSSAILWITHQASGKASRVNSIESDAVGIFVFIYVTRLLLFSGSLLLDRHETCALAELAHNTFDAQK